MDQWRGLQASATTGQQVGARLKGKQGVMVGRKRLGDDGITWPEGGNINMMHGDSRVMVVVCLETASLPAPCLSTSTSPRSREEPFFMAAPARRAPRPKADPRHIPWRRPFNGAAQGDKLLTNEGWPVHRRRPPHVREAVRLPGGTDLSATTGLLDGRLIKSNR